MRRGVSKHAAQGCSQRQIDRNELVDTHGLGGSLNPVDLLAVDAYLVREGYLRKARSLAETSEEGTDLDAFFHDSRVFWIFRHTVTLEVDMLTVSPKLVPFGPRLITQPFPPFASTIRSHACSIS
jgi:hypothetical protein